MNLLARSRLLSCRSPQLSPLTTRSIYLPNKDDKNLNPSIVLSSDGGTVICWHPQQDFPYSKTQPLPLKEDNLRAVSSVLKVQHMEASDMFNQSLGPTKYQLGEMFQMPWKHFRPRPRAKYASPYAWMKDKERDGL